MNHVTLHIVSSGAVDSCVSLTQGGIDKLGSQYSTHVYPLESTTNISHKTVLAHDLERVNRSWP